MLSFAWPWAFLLLPLPWLMRRLLPEATSMQEAGLKVPSFRSFGMLSGRPDTEQLMNWRFWVALAAWLLLVVAAALLLALGVAGLARATAGLDARLQELAARNSAGALVGFLVDRERLREQLEALKVELSQLQQRFSENVLDATAAFELLVEDDPHPGAL